MEQPVEVSELYVSDRYPMYVQRWAPSFPAGQNPPMVLVHGGAHTGTFWTSCPDGRAGWASYMASTGRLVYVVDWPGIGRSQRSDDFLTSGPAPCIEALIELLSDLGPVDLIGHSMGAAMGVMVADLMPELISALIAIGPAPPGILDSGLPPVPLTVPIRFDDAATLHYFANSDRFPKDHIAAYKRSLCDLSPSIFNFMANKGTADHALSVSRLQRLRAIPSLVIVGDQDQRVSEDMARFIANYLAAELVVVGRDWGLHGFGHMIPIEIGYEAVADKLLEWLATQRP